MRAAGLLRAVGGTASVTVLLVAAPRPPRSPAALPGWLAAAPPDAAVVDLATVTAWGCVGWLTFAAIACVLGTVPGLAGRVGAAVARCVAPIAMRRAIEAALGLSVVALPVAAPLAALADDGHSVRTWSPPSLDRPVAVSTIGPHPTAPDNYVVRPGDCLWSIARGHLARQASNHDIASAWPRWYAANRRVIGPDPALLHPGQRLAVPQRDREVPQ
jgi:nucleoid-associated protein YgaU